MTSTMPLTGPRKIAVVTGGSRGLGRSIVLNLAERGVESVFTYNTSRAEADKVVELAAETGGKASALQLDTGKTGSFGAFVPNLTAALTDLGAQRFDYLVNNAGISHHNSFREHDRGGTRRALQCPFQGRLFLTQTLLPLINDGGRIVNISTGLTRITIPGSGAYASMKGRSRC